MMPSCCEVAVLEAGITCPDMVPECCVDTYPCAGTNEVCTDFVASCCESTAVCADGVTTCAGWFDFSTVDPCCGSCADMPTMCPVAPVYRPGCCEIAECTSETCHAVVPELSKCC